MGIITRRTGSYLPPGTRKNPATSRRQGYQNNAIFIKKELKISQEAELTLLEGNLTADASAIDIVVPST